MQKQIREYRIAVAEVKAASKNHNVKQKAAHEAEFRLMAAEARKNAALETMVRAIAGEDVK